MKRIQLLATLLLTTMFNASAYDFSAISPSGHTLYYNIVNGNAVVTCPGTIWHNAYGGYAKPTGNLIIPESVTFNNQTYQVTSIGTSAFCQCDSLVRVLLPNTITSIGDAAFLSCHNLVDVNIPNSVDFIETNAFNDCIGLTSITLGTGISELWNQVFKACSNLRIVYFLSLVPPTLGYNNFIETSEDFAIYVQCNALQSYINAWGNTYNIHCFPFQLTINSNDSLWGAGSYIPLGDSIAEITATAEYGYHFDHWSHGSTANPDTLPISSDITITAIFVKNQYTVTGTSNDNTKGMVTGNATVDYLDSVTLTATSNYGYHFQRWNDFNAENPRKVAATGNINLTAIFDFNQYSVTLSTDNPIYGTVNGAGEYNYLSERLITATANYGYHFVGWNDGNTDNPRSFTLTQDTTFTALYAKNQYTMTVLRSDTTLGMVSGSGIYDYLDTAILVATAIEHYHFVRWDDGNTMNPRHIVVSDNLSRTAIFGIDTHSVALQAANIAHGTVTGSGNYQYGATATVEAFPYSGYRFTHWNNGSTYNPYTFAVLQDTILTAFFVADGEPWQDSVIIYDTVYIDVHDTTYINVFIHDTTTVVDTFMQIEYVPVYDTIYIDVHDTTYINIPYPIHDTTYIHDTTVMVDTLTLTLYDTIINTLYDTLIVTDTLWMTQHDTIWIHDTIYITQEGIDGVDALNAKVYSSQGQIVVEGAEGNRVTLYDVNGRVLATKQDDYTSLHFNAPISGTYMIKIGNCPARKVVVIR